MPADRASPRNSYVGNPLERIEDLRFLRGRGQYVDDLTARSHLHAAVLRSQVAHGRIRKIDTAAAKKIRGVHAVITGADLGKSVPNIPLRLWPMPELQAYEQPVIATTKVRYVGEPIAVAVAESAAIAEDALAAIEVDIEHLEPVTSCESAARARSLLHEGQGSNQSVVYTAEKGDTEAAFKDSSLYRRRERFSVQRHMALTMETRGLLAEWDADKRKLMVYGAAKVPFFNRRTVAKLLGLAEEQVDLIENDVGGSFGARGEFFPEDFLIPFAAIHVNRSVKWVEDRREHLLTMSHAREMQCDVEIACRRDGTIVGLRGTIDVDVGAYFRTNGTVSPRNVAQFMSGPYRIPNIHLKSHAMMTNKSPIGTYRGPGRFETDFFRERLLDMAAHDLGLDPVEFRRRNLIAREEMPYALATVSPPQKPEELDSGDYRASFDLCLKKFGWIEKSKLQGKLVDGVFHGLAAGAFIEGGAAGPRENAKIAVEADGSIAVYVGSAAVGQGLETVLSQIAADALETSIDRIRLFHGSTTYLKDGYGSYHSRSTVMGGSAILLAARALREKLIEIGAQRFGCAPSDITLSDGKAAGPNGQAIPWPKLSADGSPIIAEATFSNHKHTYAYGAAAAHVMVDPKTCAVKVVDFLLVEDVGKIVNPLTVHGQAIGSIVQGLGGALLEHLIYDESGQFVTGSLADYLIPSAADFPNIKAIMLEQYTSPHNPLGAKGAGEGGVIPVGGLIANAVAAALRSRGVEPRDLPLSPPRLWRLIDERR